MSNYLSAWRVYIEWTCLACKKPQVLGVVCCKISVTKEFQEAQKLNIPIFAMVDTNSDPNEVDFIIPSNDDASKSIEKILDIVCSAIKESLEERKKEKEIDEQKKLEEAEALSNADDTDASEEE